MQLLDVVAVVVGMPRQIPTRRMLWFVAKRRTAFAVVVVAVAAKTTRRIADHHHPSWRMLHLLLWWPMVGSAFAPREIDTVVVVPELEGDFPAPEEGRVPVARLWAPAVAVAAVLQHRVDVVVVVDSLLYLLW